ncbi:MAG TPA: kelch repeat-containing protein [Verrucomicrobiae bacterium]|jgi:hypothetical protein|nr:kelch repeat-containing protein [Verrucomicrobiae bacterium]
MQKTGVLREGGIRFVFWRSTNNIQDEFMRQSRAIFFGVLIHLFTFQNGSGATFVATGSMQVPRDASAGGILLPNGKVFAAGPVAKTNQPPAELYDPASGSWRATTFYPVPDGHTTTLLANGKVLISGGLVFQPGFTTEIASAAVYDSDTETWSPAADMVTARYSAMATLLADGRVMVAGGYYYFFGSVALADAEIYDPATGNWTATARMNTERANASIFRLPNGEVLVLGGRGFLPGDYTGGPPLDTAEIYDPQADKWRLAAKRPAGPGIVTATMLPSGKILVVGNVLGSDDQPVSPRADIYDPATGQWTDTGAPLDLRLDSTAMLLQDGKVLVCGGP